MHRKTVDEYRARTSGEKESSDTPPSDSDGRKSYSCDAFADALIEWITVNDQVCFSCYTTYTSLANSLLVY